MARLVELIHTTTPRGAGTPQDPARLVHQWFEKDGTLVVEDDSVDTRFRVSDVNAICAAFVRAWESRRVGEKPGSDADEHLANLQRGVASVVDAIAKGRTPEEIYATERAK